MSAAIRVLGRLSVASALLLAACGTTGKGSVAELSKPLLAGHLSGNFGAGLDANARALAARTEYRALEGALAGAPVNWKQSNTVYGTVTPQQAFTVGSTNCRRFTHVIFQNGQSRTSAATACRDDDGVWRPLS
jgi:surface antigen